MAIRFGDPVFGQIVPVGPGDYEHPELYLLPVFERANAMLTAVGAKERWERDGHVYRLLDPPRRAALERLAVVAIQ